MTSNNRFHSNDSRMIPYHAARGDELLQDQVFSHDALLRGLQIMAEKYGVGDLAYTPEMKEHFQEIYERRYYTDDGEDQFQMPNYAPYVDEDLANFYGLDTQNQGGGGRIVGERETFTEAVDRLLDEAAREAADSAPGLRNMMHHYDVEEWARYGVAEEKPYVHYDADVTLFRNEDGGWSTMDRPASTSDRSNVINMYDAVPDYTFPTPHPGWTIDRPGGYYDSLDDRDEVATGF